MQIIKNEAVIKLNDGEAADIAYCVNSSLLNSIESHYNRLQQNQDGEELFFGQERIKLHIMKNMFAVAGNVESYASCVQRYRNMFVDHRLEREKEIENV